MSKKTSALQRLTAKASQEKRTKDTFGEGYRVKLQEIGDSPLHGDSGFRAVYGLVNNPRDVYTQRERGEIAAVALTYLKGFARDFGHRTYLRSNEPAYKCLELLERIGLGAGGPEQRLNDVAWKYVGEILKNRLRVAGDESESGGLREGQAKAAEELKEYILKKAEMDDLED